MLEIFKQSFMQTALLGGLITGCLCAYLGVFVILKRIVFIGIALSEISALGLALGLLVGIDPLISASILTFLGIILFWLPFKEKNVSRESLIGFIYAFCAAISVILIAKNPFAQGKGLDLLSGNLLYTSWQDIKILGVVSFFVLIVHLVFFKEFIFVSFDKETAFTTGLRANFIDFLLYLTIGLVISLSMKACGVIFVFASLIIPAMIGLITAKRVGRIFFISCLIASFAVLLGLISSYIWDLPTAPCIVGLYGILFILSLAVKNLFGEG